MITFKKIIKVIYENIMLAIASEKYQSKVFCIGFNKTGTTSLGESLKMLGYRHSTFNEKVWLQYYMNNDIVKILKYTAKFESLDDLPWLKEDMIPILDRVFPNSKFIYLTRDEESWKKSIYHWTYKMTGKYPHIDDCLNEYRGHREFVLNYFKDRSDKDFLSLDIREENGFEKLACFLGKKTALKNFPRYNKTFENK